MLSSGRARDRLCWGFSAEHCLDSIRSSSTRWRKPRSTRWSRAFGWCWWSRLSPTNNSSWRVRGLRCRGNKRWRLCAGEKCSWTLKTLELDLIMMKNKRRSWQLSSPGIQMHSDWHENNTNELIRSDFVSLHRLCSFWFNATNQNLFSQSLRWQHLIRAEGGHNPRRFSSIRTNQVDQHVVGSCHAKAQRLRLRRVWDPGGSAAGFGADERCHAWRTKHQSWAAVQHAASGKRIEIYYLVQQSQIPLLATSHRWDSRRGQELQPNLHRVDPSRADRRGH